MYTLATPSDEKESKIRKWISSDGAEFEDLVDLFPVPTDPSILQFGDWAISLNGLTLTSQAGVLAYVCLIRDHCNFPMVLGDALALAIQLTNHVSRFKDQEVVEALCEWFSQIESDGRIDDDEAMPKMVLAMCREELALR